MSDPEDIRKFLRLSDRVTTSGRLEAHDPARLAEMGAKRVINLAMDDHPDALPGEAEAMASAGLEYTHIPVPFDAPTEAHFRAFVEALEASDDPVHVHCIMNWRVSAFFYLYHVRIIGIAEPRARAIMEKIWTPAETNYPHCDKWADFIERVQK